MDAQSSKVMVEGTLTNQMFVPKALIRLIALIGEPELMMAFGGKYLIGFLIRRPPLCAEISISLCILTL